MNRRSFLQAIGAGLVLAGSAASLAVARNVRKASATDGRRMGCKRPGFTLRSFSGASWVRVGEDLYFYGANGRLYVMGPSNGVAELIV